MVLKLTMAPVEQIPAFVDQTTKLLPDCDFTEFSKILDMKGYKKQEQGPFLECFKTKSNFHNESGVRANSELESPDTSYESSRIKKLEKLIKKRL